VSRQTLKPDAYFADLEEIADITEETKTCVSLIVKLIDGEAVD
jgi:hypothetical protein